MKTVDLPCENTRMGKASHRGHGGGLRLVDEQDWVNIVDSLGHLDPQEVSFLRSEVALAS
jgi:hypothetical protein